MPHHQLPPPTCLPLAVCPGCPRAQPMCSQHIAQHLCGKDPSLYPAHWFRDRDPPARGPPAYKWQSKDIKPGVPGSRVMFLSEAGPTSLPVRSPECLHLLSTLATSHSFHASDLGLPPPGKGTAPPDLGSRAGPPRTALKAQELAKGPLCKDMICASPVHQYGWLPHDRAI